MRFEQLEVFRAVAELKSFTLAAKRLYVSQPSISQQVALLERELGFRLFERNSKGVELTPAGDFFYQELAQALDSFKALVQAARSVAAASGDPPGLGGLDFSVKMKTIKEGKAL